MRNFTQFTSQEFHKKLILILKRVASNAIFSGLSGKFIAAIYNDRIPFRNCIIDTRCEAIADSTKARLFWGAYEVPELRFIDKYLRSDLDVIELGSSIGVLASFCGKKLESTSHLICVEANPLIIGCLKSNIENNVDVTNKSVVHAAIDYSCEQSSIEFSVMKNILCSKLGHEQNAKYYFQVPKTTLSSILSEYNVANYTLICDIEGAEKELLERETEALQGCQQLHIEIHNTVLNDNPVRIKDVISLLLEKHGFKMLEKRELGDILAICVFER